MHRAKVGPGSHLFDRRTVDRSRRRIANTPSLKKRAEKKKKKKKQRRRASDGLHVTAQCQPRLTSPAQLVRSPPRATHPFAKRHRLTFACSEPAAPAIASPPFAYSLPPPPFPPPTAPRNKDRDIKIAMPPDMLEHRPPQLRPSTTHLFVNGGPFRALPLPLCPGSRHRRLALRPLLRRFFGLLEGAIGQWFGYWH